MAQELFTTSTTWTCPEGITLVDVELWGGGGAGGSAQGAGSWMCGGAGGNYVKSTLSVIPGNQYAIVVAAQRNGAPSGGLDGYSSIFGDNLAVATGGKGGGSDSNVNNTIGGIVYATTTGCIGDIIYKGGDGGAATSGSTGGGGGGAGSTGNGNSANGITAGSATSEYGGAGGAGKTNNTTPNAGSLYGGGGAGSYSTSGSNMSGGHGRAGLVRLTYTFPASQINGIATIIINTITQLKGTGKLSGTTIVTANNNANIKGKGYISCSTPISISNTSLIKGKGLILANTLVKVNTSAQQRGRGKLTGITSANLTSTGKLRGKSNLFGNTIIDIGSVTTLKGKTSLSGNTTIAISTIPLIKGRASLNSICSIQFSGYSNLTYVFTTKQINSSTNIQLSTTSSLKGLGKIYATGILQITQAGVLKGKGKLDSITALQLYNNGNLKGWGSLTGNSDTVFILSSILNATAILSGNTTVTINQLSNLTQKKKKMYNVGYAIKQHLLNNPDVSAITTKVYNVVAMSIDNQISPPYIVIDIDNLVPNNYKDLYSYDEINFAINILAKQYDDIAELSEIVRLALEYKTIDSGVRDLQTILFTDYSESFDSNFNLYRTRLTFSTKGIINNN